MSERKYNFDEENRGTPEAARLAGVALGLRKLKMEQQLVKLADDEKRWLRKKRLATTKLKQATAAKRRLRKRHSTISKQLKGRQQNEEVSM